MEIGARMGSGRRGWVGPLLIGNVYEHAVGAGATVAVAAAATTVSVAGDIRVRGTRGSCSGSVTQTNTHINTCLRTPKYVYPCRHSL